MVLKAKQIEHADEGMHADGNGLYLRVQAGGSKGWIFRFQLNGRRREMGIGTLVERNVTQARAVAAELRAKVKAGIDPIDARDAEKTAAKEARQGKTTFAQVAKDYIAAHRPGWSNAKHADQWENTLETYVYPVIGKKSITDISTEDVLQILTPLWTTKTETATRLRSRIELVLSYAKARKMRHGENPAMWRGHLDALLPPANKVRTRRHHPALPFSRVADFLTALREVPGSSARALELVILTAARSKEVREATWSEFDLDAKVWKVPAEHMKARREHWVPLSDAAVNLIRELPRFVDEKTGEQVVLLFPSIRAQRPLSDMALTQTIRRMDEVQEGGWRDDKGDVITAHGFRSTFRDWAGETTGHAREVVEHALAHQLPDKVEAAYARGTLFDKRRLLMDDWAVHCRPKTGKVVSITSAKRA